MSYFDILAARAGAGGGAPTPQPVLIEKSVTHNGTYTALEDEADGYSSVSVEVPNTYSANDEGKVVSNGALVTQTATSTTTNGTIDTTTNNSVTVNVPNTYTQADEGKVVSNGALAAQTAYPSTITNNGIYDTTENNSVTVDIPSLPTGIEVAKLTPENNNISDSDMYIINAGNRTYIVGHFKRITGSPTPQFSYPSTFVPLFTKRPSSDSQNYFITNQTTGTTISYSSGTAYISNNLVTVYGATAGTIYNYAIMFTTN